MIEDGQHRARYQAGMARALCRGGQEHDRVRAIAAVVMEVMLDNTDVREAEPVASLGERQRLVKILCRRFLLGFDVRKELDAEFHGRLPGRRIRGIAPRSSAALDACR